MIVGCWPEEEEQGTRILFVCRVFEVPVTHACRDAWQMDMFVWSFVGFCLKIVCH